MRAMRIHLAIVACIALHGSTRRLHVEQDSRPKDEHGVFKDWARIPRGKAASAVALAALGRTVPESGFRVSPYLSQSSHAMKKARGASQMKIVDPDDELMELVNIIPGLAGLVDESRRKKRLEVGGIRLNRNKWEDAFKKRQLDSVIHNYGTARWSDLAQAARSEFEKSENFPADVKELEEILALPGNDIFDKKHAWMQRTHSDYEEVLGKGVSGVVYKRTLAVNGKEDFYAVKTIPFSNDTKEQGEQVKLAVREIRAMNKVEDPHIVRLHDVYFLDMWDGEGVSPMLHIVMDCGSGSYSSFLSYQEDESWDSFRYEAFLADMIQMFVSVRTLHKSGIAHRDVKFGNFVYFQTAGPPILKLIDFGHADGPGIGGAFQSKELRGTPELVSPEVAQNFLESEVIPNEVDGRSMDTWALGIMMYFLMIGAYPFHRGDSGDDVKDIEILCAKVVDYRANWPNSQFRYNETTPMAIKTGHIINGLLHPFPASRMSLGDAISELRRLLQESLDTRQAAKLRKKMKFRLGSTY